MKYRKKPELFEASQWHKLGDHPNVHTFYPTNEPCSVCGEPISKHGQLFRATTFICPGDYVITDAHGNLSVCKQDAFRKTYEPAEPHTEEN